MASVTDPGHMHGLTTRGRAIGWRRAFVALALATAIGCGDNDAPDPTPPPTTLPTPTVVGTPAAACPTRLTVGLLGTQADFDFGSSGIAHDSPLPEAAFAVGLSCSSAPSGACGRCTITGLADDAGGVAHRRCFGSLDACATAASCGGTACESFLTPPLPLSTGGAPACVLQRLTREVTGTYHPAAGGLDAHLGLDWVFYGAIALEQPCPVCRQDANGGHRCVGGERDGAFCTVHARAVLGDTSFDCPPKASVRVSNVAFDLDLATLFRSLDATALCASGAPGCLCPAQRARNDCLDGVCRIGDDGEGRCPAGPIDRQCAREPYRPCATDGECPTPGDTCVDKIRECLGNADSATIGPLVRRGTTDPARPVLAAVTCIPASQSSLQNQALGLPGPLALRLPATFCTAEPCAP
jgi:hypothetical protein